MLRRRLGFRSDALTQKPQSRRQVWSIGIYTGRSPLDLGPAPGIKNPVLTRESISDVPASFVADPFMVRTGRTWYMFFEVLNSQSGNGEIALATSDDTVHWNYRQIVLREPFHLSYPYVFEWEGRYYMVPESYQAKSARLYRAVDFPLKWKFVTNLIEGDDFEDNSLFYFNDRWWLLNDLSRLPYFAGTLRVFHSERLTGPWTEHVQSPVITGDPHSARPAGRVLAGGDKVMRFAQDCCPVYGARVRAFELTELTTTTFRETELSPSPVLEGAGQGWNADGMHHMDPHFRDDDGKWIASVDGWHWNS
jgi:hypothetical protein